jgi:hypothetical protein
MNVQTSANKKDSYMKELNGEEKLFALTQFPSSPTFTETLNSPAVPYSDFVSDHTLLENTFKDVCCDIPFPFLRFLNFHFFF